ncbi:MAG: hypothetical protein WCS01_10915, partial [bacterium]
MHHYYYVSAPSVSPKSPSDALKDAVKNSDNNGIDAALARGAKINGACLLIIAASDSNIDTIRHLIRKGADVNERNCAGQTCLFMHWNRHESDYADPFFDETGEILRLLLEAKGDLTIRDDNGDTPLIYAVRFSQAHDAMLLIKAGADYHARDALGLSIFDIAAKLGPAFVDLKPGLLKVLAVLPRDMRSLEENYTNTSPDVMLNAGVEKKDMELVRLALSKGAHPGIEHVCAVVQAGDVPLLRLLLENGADVKGTTASTVSCIHRLVFAPDDKVAELFRILHEAGAPINKQDSGGYTPIARAAFCRQAATLIKVLMQAGADLSIPTFQSGAPFIALVRGNTHASYDDYFFKRLMTQLLELPPEQLFPKGDPKWALQLGIEYSRHAFVEYAFRLKSPPPNAEQTYMAITLGNVEIVRTLLANGTPIKQMPSSLHCLMSTPTNTAPAILGMLLAAGADIEAVDPASGLTPVQCAATGRNQDIFISLAKAGANVTKKDKTGRTALELMQANTLWSEEKKA